MAQNSKKQSYKDLDYDKLSFREYLAITKWIFSLQFAIDKRNSILYLIIRTLNGLTPIGYTYLTAALLDKAIETVQQVGDLSSMYPYLIALFVFTLVQRAFSFSRNYLWWMLEPQMQPKLRKVLYEKLIGLGIQTLEDPEVTNKVDRATNNMHQVFNYFRQTSMIISHAVSFIVALVLVAIEFPIMVPVILFAAIPSILYDKKYRALSWGFNFVITEKARTAWSGARVLVDPKYLQEIIAIGADRMLDKKFVDFFTWQVKEQRKIFKRWFSGKEVLDLLKTFAHYFGYVLVLSKLLVSKITVGGVFFNIRLIERLSNNLDTFAEIFNNQFERTLRFKDAYSLFMKEPAFPDGKVVLETLTKGPTIDIKGLDFAYPRIKKLVIRDLNIAVASGEKIAIVGHNGAGKTTLAKLIMRMYMPSSGVIEINGISTIDLKTESLHKNSAVLFQDYNTYSQLTAAENVYIGGVNLKQDKKAMEDALKKADAWEFVNDFPNGLNQILDEKYEGGIRPSTGQWQKIAIARFFYRNAPLIIFDEPTAAIDAVSEYNIFNKIYNFFKDKTVILISHRFSTVRNADRIIVLEGGRIIEEGSHEELMANKGYYAKSFKLQAEGYSTST